MSNPEADERAALIVKPKVAWKMLSCSNTRGYELLAAGELDSFLDGRSRNRIDRIRFFQLAIRDVRRNSEGSILKRPELVASWSESDLTTPIARLRRCARYVTPHGITGSTQNADHTMSSM
jgi:hypothetical protein